MVYLGKLPPPLLEKIVFPFQGTKRKEVLFGAGLGRDCGIVNFGEDLVAVTCDPITGAPGFLGIFAVQVVVNDLVCSGAEPVALLLSLIFPPHSSPEEIEGIMREVDTVCREFGIAVLGGHTEISPVVTKPLVHCAGLGRVRPGFVPDVTAVAPGDAILITKGVGIEGTAILAWERESELQEAFGARFAERAKGFLSMMSVFPEARVILPLKPHCLHDVTEGGLLGALWEVCSGRGLGFEIEEQRVFVFPETESIAHYFHIDPLRLISSGTLLVFTPSPREIMSTLEALSIPVFEIGVVTACRSMKIRRKDGRIEEVTTCPQDELWRVIARL